METKTPHELLREQLAEQARREKKAAHAIERGKVMDKFLSDHDKANEVVKVYEFDFGDTNLIDESITTITDWIATEMQDLAVGESLEYTITAKQMTRKELKELPEWS